MFKAFPNHGALGKAYAVTRTLQILSMLGVIGITARLVDEMIQNSTEAPPPFVAILAICCMAAIYCGITLILYVDNTLPLLIATVIDTLFLIALMTASVIVGKPLSYLSCTKVGQLAAESGFTSIKDYITGIGSSVGKAPLSTVSYTIASDGSLKEIKGVNYAAFTGGSERVCHMMKATWAFAIVLTITFVVSSFATAFIWKNTRARVAKKVEDIEA